MAYNWQLKDWPDFSYDLAQIHDLLIDSVERISLLTGGIKELEDKNKLDAVIKIMLSEALKSSEIEGELLNQEAVFSSIRQQMGLKPTLSQKNSKADSITRVIVDAYRSFDKTLTIKQLNNWHASLFQDHKDIVVGDFRKHKEPMQVVSGDIGKPKIHFQAPPSASLKKEMRDFVKWFNQTASKQDQEIKAAPIRAAITHLYFESIHPYEDGNGRIGRVLAEKALSQTMGYPLIICMSLEIESKKKLYYSKLEEAQKSNEITEWLEYFLAMLIKASYRTEKIIQFVIKKSQFFKRHSQRLNQRQTKTVQRMLEEGVEGFQGGMTAAKYIKITKCSKATATRDLADLLESAVFIKRPGEGRSTSYDLNL
ncbi:MAG: Fic family protein [Cyanobacteria bacterium]|nr:Fic family protein [Cyanobacteriota bacterium]